MRIKNKSNHKI